jgi:peptidoglycan/xylan/chitin deacetylase (PgdA/CDA1 family)
MGVRHQDITPILFHRLGFSWFRQRLYCWRGFVAARFLAFHDVTPQERDAFESKLHFLRERTNVISLDDFFDRKFSLRQPNVVITFDDGYKGWSITAAPALRRMGLPATFFVTSGFVGLDSGREAEFIRNRLKTNCSTTGGLSEAELRRLAEQGFTIGGHTRSHANLSELRDESTVRRELAEDKQRLELITGKPVRHFAYPLGAYLNTSLRLPEILQLVGYRSASTVVPGFNTSKSNPYELRRDLTSAGLALSAFKARVLGNHDAAALLKGYSLSSSSRNAKTMDAAVARPGGHSVL